MPPKSIASYFSKPAVQASTKLPSAPGSQSPKAAVSTLRSKSPSSPSSVRPSQVEDVVDAPTVTAESKTPSKTTASVSDGETIAGAPPSPLTAVSSEATPSSSKKRSGLPDAMRQAIADGMADAERQLKRAKVDPGSDSSSTPTTALPTSAEKPKIASIFAKPSAGSSTIASPLKALASTNAKTRQELREALEKHPQKLELLQMELDNMGKDWLLALQGELTKPYFLTLKGFVTKEQATKRVFPPAQEVYSWSTLCPLKDIRVVIIGQDPYHDDNQAHGLAFSVRKGMRIPPSLRNIYKQMHDDIPGFQIPKHGDLTEWAKHGVLLLNTSLTVRAHEAGSHSNKGWETFTAAVLKVVTSRLTPSSATNASDTTGHVAGANGVVFMAWGNHALKMCAGVDQKKHLILKSAHPSPLAASRGFFGNGHFKKANEWLEGRYGPGGGIDWASLGGS